MSSILKALRKLEEEKRGGKLEAPDLQVDQGRPDTTGRPFIPLLIGAVLGILLIGLFFLWPIGSQYWLDLLQGESPVPAAPAVAPVQPLPQAVVEQPAVAAPAKPVPRTSVPASVEPETPVATAAAVTEPVMPQVKPASGSATISQSKNHEPAGAAATAQQSGIVVQQELSPDSAKLPAGISLLVSEIFYLDDINSMAVVNDLPVMIGSHVDSAVVTAIHADRVLFEIDGKAYTVSLSQP